MKRFIFRFLKFTGILLLLAFISAFTWANWEQPGPGMKAPVVDFVQYDMTNTILPKTNMIQATLAKQRGIVGATYNAESELLVVAYRVDNIDRNTFEMLIAKSYSTPLKEKQFQQSGSKCPVDLAWISYIKKTLCLRD